MIITGFWAILLLYIIGAAAACAVPGLRRAIVAALACAALGGVVAILVAVGVVLGVPASAVRLDTGLPFGPLTLGADALTGFFLIVIGLVSVAAAVYAVGYLGRHVERRPLRLTLLLFNLLLLTLVAIVSATDAVTFLLAWETMAFLSYLAVNFEYEDLGVIRAGYEMLAISELGTIGIIGAFLLLGHAGGGFSFAALRTGAGQLSPGLRDLVFLLTLFGFGAKAGLLPLQLWLPKAHAAAPSHLSGLLSAVIVKMGLYGIFRVVVDFLGGGPVWWGLLMLGLGGVTALFGILYAFIERDLKRILAYSTIENVGIIVAALGASLTYRSSGLGTLAAITGLFTLYHILNHAVYKGLLFLAVGAVGRATGTRDLERLGGLIRRMPWTALAVLVGSLAIAAVAPFAGYLSEWGILESMLQSFALRDVPSKLVVSVVGAVIALTVALGATTFVRAFAVGFLAQPRSDAAFTAQEVPPSMGLGMSVLAIASIFLGTLPALVLTALDRVSTPLWGTSVLDRVVPPLFTDHPGDYASLVSLGGGLFRGLPINGLVIVAAPSLSTINSPTYLVLAEAILLGLLVLGMRRVRSLGTVRVGPVWSGGIPAFSPRMQYGAIAYSNPARLIFNGIYNSHAEFRMISGAPADGDGQISYLQHIPPPLEEGIYRPIARALDAVARWAGVIQSGSTNQYILYIFAIVLGILVLQGAVWTSWLTYGLDLLVAGVVLLVLRSLRRDDQADRGR